MTWDPKLYGTTADPVRQSDLNSSLGDYGCGRRWAFRKQEAALPEGPPPPEKEAYQRIVGTGIHWAIEKIVSMVDLGAVARPQTIKDLVKQGIEDEQRATIDWYDSSLEKELRDSVPQVQGAIRTLCERASEIVAVEAPYISKVGDHWTSGTIDIVYRNKQGKLALADWKTGKRVISPEIRTYGYQFGLYGNALHRGILFPGEEGELVLGEWPEEIHCVMTRDFVPYTRKSRKRIDSYELADWLGKPKGSTHEFEAGDERGPGWYASKRDLESVPRLEHSVDRFVKMVRAGFFPERIGTACRTCRFREECFGQGYMKDETVERLARTLQILEEKDTEGDVT